MRANDFVPATTIACFQFNVFALSINQSLEIPLGRNRPQVVCRRVLNVFICHTQSVIAAACHATKLNVSCFFCFCFNSVADQIACRPDSILLQSHGQWRNFFFVDTIRSSRWFSSSVICRRFRCGVGGVEPDDDEDAICHRRDADSVRFVRV